MKNQRLGATSLSVPLAAKLREAESTYGSARPPRKKDWDPQFVFDPAGPGHGVNPKSSEAYKQALAGVASDWRFPPERTESERPWWMARAAPLEDQRRPMYDQPSLDNSAYRLDTIGFARHHAVEERKRYQQMVRYFDSDGNGWLDVDELVAMWLVLSS